MQLESVEKDKLFAALSKFQGNLKATETNRTGARFGSKYADLHSHLNPIREDLAEVELSVSEFSFIREDGRHIYGIKLMHSSGQFTSNTFPFYFDEPNGKDSKCHKIGGSYTYFFRYHVKGMLGLTVSDDPDDNDLQEEKKKEYKTPSITKETATKLKNMLKDYESIENQILRMYHAEDISELPLDKRSEIEIKIVELIQKSA